MRRRIAGWRREYLRQNKFDLAADELDKAAELNPRDPWIWYYRSALKYQKAQATRQDMQGLANMMQDLRAVTDWYPELADAYNMLGMARVEGGGINSALEAQRQAIALAPRNVEYQFNLGQIYVAGKKWDLAREVFTRLKAGPDQSGGSGGERTVGRLRHAAEVWSASATSGGKRGASGAAASAVLKMRTRMRRRNRARQAGNDRADAISERQDREQRLLQTSRGNGYNLERDDDLQDACFGLQIVAGDWRRSVFLRVEEPARVGELSRGGETRGRIGVD